MKNMKIQNGKLYVNKTWEYVYPCLQYYGEDLSLQLKKFFKLGVGLGDVNYEEYSDGTNIFILFETDFQKGLYVDTVQYKKDFNTFLHWIKYKSYYVTDYLFSGLQDRKKHMLVLKIPYKHRKSIPLFKKGKYSEMYSRSEVLEYFRFIPLENKEVEVIINDKLKRLRSILLKDRDYIDTFVKEVNTRFGTDNPRSDFLDAELDFPPNPEKEIFNKSIKQIKV